MKDLKHPAKSLSQNELNLEDERIASEEDYHNEQLRRKDQTFEKNFKKENRFPMELY